MQIARNGVLPTTWLPYEKSTPLEKELEDVVKWFTNDSFNYDLALIYYGEPDATGHWAGPESENISFVLKNIDTVFGNFIGNLKRIGVLDKV